MIFFFVDKVQARNYIYVCVLYLFCPDATASDAECMCEAFFATAEASSTSAQEAKKK